MNIFAKKSISQIRPSANMYPENSTYERSLWTLWNKGIPLKCNIIKFHLAFEYVSIECAWMRINMSNFGTEMCHSHMWELILSFVAQTEQMRHKYAKYTRCREDLWPVHISIIHLLLITLRSTDPTTYCYPHAHHFKCIYPHTIQE